MDYAKSIEPVTVLETKSADLIRRAQHSGQPIIITQNGKATAVLQDIESYQRGRQALMHLKYLARGDQDERDRRIVSDEEADQHFRDTLAAMKAGA